jgi:MerR family transcriptional regulator, thiopeptide resistance regulator
LKTGNVYRVRQFAEIAGVTVRALHHYDRLGLLKPSGRTERGYRLYRDRDLARLEQIVVLKFLGVPLKDIARLLRRESSLADTLRRQQHVLADKRRHIDVALHAIATAEESARAGDDPDWNLFRTIVKELDMENNTDWSKKYYSADAQAKVEQRKALWNPELQAQVTAKWTALVADVERALDEDPAGPKAQALAARWRTLVEAFTGGDRDIQHGLNNMWPDKENWPARERERFHIDPRVQAFIISAMNAASR